jgi:uronate dehydrogenase
MRHVLVTGAAGRIGRWTRQLLSGVYPLLRLSDVKPMDPPRPGEEIMEADLADLGATERLMEAIDGVVHLGAMSVEAPWDVILRSNIEATYNVFEAARRRGVRRVVFASTNHVVGFYRRDQRIDHRAAPRPDSRYGVSKAFGEALGALYADKYGLEVFVIRIGNVTETPVDERRLSIWTSPRDFVQLARIGLEHPDIRYEIVYGVSDNARSFWDNGNAHRLGYRPQNRSEPHAETVLRREDARERDPVARRFQGGTFCSDEYVEGPGPRGA